MSPWRQLYEAHEALRASAGEKLAELRKRLARAGERGHCDRGVASRFTYERMDTGRRWYMVNDGEPLTILREGLSFAKCRVDALSDNRDRLRDLKVMIDGINVEGRPVTLAAHLTEGPEGNDACGHALLHCHVGPTLDTLPKVRVPLPALAPAEILDWMFAVVLDGWEPIPWPQILDLDSSA